MSAALIEVQCPGCEAVLELDPGFAGGVCRCADCGTLPTVPSADAPQAERVERPDRPEAGPEYRTASGRSVQIADFARIPLAPVKRKAVRAVTGTVFFLIVGSLLVLAAVAVYQVVSEPSAEQVAAATYVETFTFDPQRNPLEIEAPNLFGLPLANEVAVIYDTTSISTDQRNTVNALLLDGLRRVAPAVRVSVALALPEGVTEPLVPTRALNGDPTDNTAEHLRDIPANTEATGSLLRAVAEAADRGPGVMILVTARPIADDEAEALLNLIDPGATRIDAVLLDTDSFGLEDATRTTGGHFVTLDTDAARLNWLPPE